MVATSFEMIAAIIDVLLKDRGAFKEIGSVHYLCFISTVRKSLVNEQRVVK